MDFGLSLSIETNSTEEFTMKAIVIADTPTILTVRFEFDVDEMEARETVGIPGIYHKRSNGLWIIVKDS